MRWLRPLESPANVAAAEWERGGWQTPLSRETIAVPHEDPQARQLRHFLRVVRREEAPRVDGADATRTLAVVRAVQESAKSARAVRL